jgi:hypothetical protein
LFATRPREELAGLIKRTLQKREPVVLSCHVILQPGFRDANVSENARALGYVGKCAGGLLTEDLALGDSSLATLSLGLSSSAI